jgi:hypothetical protein
MVGAFDRNNEIDPTFLNVNNAPEDTYELDQIDQHSSDLPNNPRPYGTKTNTWQYL